MINVISRKVVDVARENFIPLATVKKLDDILLQLTLVKNGAPLNVTGQTLSLRCKKVNKESEELSNTSTDTPIVINGSNVDIKLRNSMINKAGKVNFELNIRDTNGSMTTASFYLIVTRLELTDDSVESSEQFSILDELIKNYNKLSSTDTTAEVVSARGTYSALGDRLDDFLSIINVLKNREIRLSEVGCSTDESKATNNTTIIQTLINKGVNIVVDGIYPISSTLSINSFSQKNIKGIHMYKSGFLMITDNIPILEVTKHDVNAMGIFDILLKFKNIQNRTSCTNGYGIRFKSTTSNSNGAYNWVLNNIRFENCFKGIGNTSKGKFPIWGMRFGNLYFKNTVDQAINTMSEQACGQPNNQVDYIKIFNDNGLSDLNNYECGYAIQVMGEWTFRNVDIESWSKKTIRIDSGMVSFDTIHIEHMYLGTNGNNAIQLQGNVIINNLYIVYEWVESTSIDTAWFWFYSGNYYINNVSIEKHSSIADDANAKKIQFISVQTTSGCNIDLNGYSFRDNKTKLCDYWESKVISALNKNGRKIYYADSTPIAGSYPLGLIIYNSNWNGSLGSPEGWMCVEAGSPGKWKGFNTISGRDNDVLSESKYRVSVTDYSKGYIENINSIEGNNSTLFMEVNTGRFVKAHGYTETEAIITNDITYGDKYIVVDDVSEFAKDDIILLRLGDNAYDTNETSFNIITKITSITADENKININDNLPISLTLSSVTNSNNKKVIKLLPNIENKYYRNLNLIAGEVANCEMGLDLRALENVKIENIVGNNLGAGAVVLAYCKNVVADNIKMLKCNATNNQTSKGRTINIWNCQNVTFNNITTSGNQGTPIFIESYCKDIVFNNTMINCFRTDRVADPLIGVMQYSNAIFNNLTINTNLNVPIFNDGGSNGYYIVNNLTINTSKIWKGGLHTDKIHGMFKVDKDGSKFTMNFDKIKKEVIEIELTDGLYKNIDMAKTFITSYKIECIGCDFSDINGAYHKVGSLNRTNILTQTMKDNGETSYSKYSIGIGSDYNTDFSTTQGFLISCSGITGLTDSGKKVKITYEYVDIE